MGAAWCEPFVTPLAQHVISLGMANYRTGVGGMVFFECGTLFPNTGMIPFFVLSGHRLGGYL
ncbi:MAG: hypothetical protein RL518_1192 [Pseudomonadota bacterium]|jgi:hypothetical protein